MKIAILLFSIIFCAATLKAQYVAIPDSNFRNVVRQQVPGCFNADGLLDTTCTSLSAVTSLDFYIGEFFLQYGLNLDGIQYLTSLKTFHADDYNILNFAKMPNSVITIRIEECGLYDSVKLPDHLQYLEYFASGGLSSSIVLPKTLRYLDYDEAYVTVLPALPGSLGTLICPLNYLTNLPALPSSLTYLDCSMNPTLFCLPKLPNGLTTLALDSTINCLPNHPPKLAISQYFYSGISTKLPLVCDSTNDTNGCTIYNTCTWAGIIDSTWENPANWSCNKLPDSTTDIIIDSGKVVISSNPVIKSLQASSNAQVIITTGYKLTILK